MEEYLEYELNSGDFAGVCGACPTLADRSFEYDQCYSSASQYVAGYSDARKVSFSLLDVRILTGLARVEHLVYPL
jgi:hypothetical protein